MVIETGQILRLYRCTLLLPPQSVGCDIIIAGLICVQVLHLDLQVTLPESFVCIHAAATDAINNATLSFADSTADAARVQLVFALFNITLLLVIYLNIFLIVTMFLLIIQAILLQICFVKQFKNTATASVSLFQIIVRHCDRGDREFILNTGFWSMVPHLVCNIILYVCIL